MLDPLFIGEPNTIYVQIVGVTGATATFSITTADVANHTDVAGNEIGTPDVSMAYNSAFAPDASKPTETIAAYVGTYSADDAALLVAATDENANYKVWITAAGYTLRCLPRVATYRGRT